MYKFLLELRRRSVFRVAGGYAVLAWLLIQLAMALETTLLLPDWFDTSITVTLILGFPVAIILAWAFEMTPEGFKRTEADHDIEQRNHKLRVADGIIAAGLVALVGVSYWTGTRPQTVVAASSTRAEGNGTASSLQQSIAVLPFQDMAADNQEYFSDGIAEEILNALVRVPELRVVGRTSAFAFKGQNATLKEIGDQLAVKHILEGSVRKAEDVVRITASLTEAQTGTTVWSQTYNDSLRDIFDLQETIARDVAKELSVVLELSEGTRLADELTDNPAAYEAFLRGRGLVNDAWGQQTIPLAVDFLNIAVEQDPTFVEAWELLSYANFLYPTYAIVPSEKPYLKAAEAAADRALALKPSSADGYAMKSVLRLAENRFAEAIRLIDFAAMLEPDNAEIRYARGYRLSSIGHTDDALPDIRAALRDNPNNPFWQIAEAVTLLNAGRLDEAESAAQRVLDAGFAGAAYAMADILLVQGRRQEAFDFMMSMHDEIGYISPEFQDFENWQTAGKAFYLEDPQALAQMDMFLQGMLQNPDIPMSTAIMNGLVGFGDPELFMEAFANRPFANGSYVLSRLWDGRQNPTKIRTHPDFPAWADRIGLVETWQEFGWPEKCTPERGTDGSNGRFSCT
ncbi:MAG: hypothetical protein HRU11_11525 [Parvularculaceae bacterium]|nr:hypothetical protein [Parvularculaceae bacterium]